MRCLACGACVSMAACLGQLALADKLPAANVGSATASSDPPPVETAPAAESIDSPADEVIVTGRRLLISAQAPVTVLDRGDLERRGASSLGDVLQALPQNAGSPLNTNVNMGGELLSGSPRGDGSARVTLRGHNTVVLLNGRRFPGGGLGADASVDLNSLPVSFVERVEVLPSGASVIYGADAVGGVINVVTRRESDGFTFAASHALAEHGDGPVTAGQAAAGLEVFGGSWILGIDYVQQDGATLDRRGYSSVPVFIVDGDGTRDQFRKWATPQGRFLVPAGNALGLAPGTYTRVEGATGQTAADYRLFDPARDFFDIAPFNYSQTPGKRAALWLTGSLPLGERVNLFVEGLVHHRESVQQAAPEPYMGGVLPILPDGSAGIPANNYYNPFGVDLVRGGSSCRGAECIFPVGRRFVELGNYGFSEDVDLWRALLGLEGRVAAWGWSLSFAHAESDAASVESGTLFRSRLVPALGPSGPDATGRIVCGSPDPDTGVVAAAAIIPGCVPLNLFGGPGSLTQEQLDYISPGRMLHTGRNEQQTVQLILSGPWGRLSERDLRWVLGADYRREAGAAVLDPERAAEFEETSLSGGRYEARELFAEVELPVLRDRPLARELDVNLGLRWSDFSSFDSHLSRQAGLRWRPLGEWTFRATWSDVFRAPELWELYDPGVRIQGFDIDPCGNRPTTVEQANCAANGVPGGAYVQGDEEFEIRAGGNPSLEPEEGHSVGAGLVYTPRWARRLSLSTDFWLLEISNLISQLSVDQALTECARHGLPQVCDDIERFPDGRVRRVSTLNENFDGRYETRGVDFAIDWAVTTRFGELNSSLLATWLERWDEQPLLAGTTFEHAGKFSAGAMPRWRGLGTVDLAAGRWHAGYSAQYIGSYTQQVDPTALGEPFLPYTRSIEPVLYHDIEGEYEFENGVTVRAAITNLTGEDPPFVNLASAANTDVGTYRLLGRTYFLELRYGFVGGT